jgi:hypothetical protein
MHGTSDRAEIFFYKYYKHVGAPAFFYFEKYCTAESYQVFQEKHYLKKTCVVRVLFVFLLFYLKEGDRKKPQKNEHPKVSLVFIKEFSAERMYYFGETGAIREAFFDLCAPHSSLKEAFGNFESMATFSLLTKIYLP